MQIDLYLTQAENEIEASIHFHRHIGVNWEEIAEAEADALIYVLYNVLPICTWREFVRKTEEKRYVQLG